MVVVETNGTGPRQQVPWRRRAVRAGSSQSPAETGERWKLPARCCFSASQWSALPPGKQKPTRVWGRVEQMHFNSKYGLVIYQCRVIEVISCRF